MTEEQEDNMLFYDCENLTIEGNTSAQKGTLMKWILLLPKTMAIYAITLTVLIPIGTLIVVLLGVEGGFIATISQLTVYFLCIYMMSGSKAPIPSVPPRSET